VTTIQAPIHSGFGGRTTAQEALAGQDLGGKTAIVTGGYSGIGLETTRALADAGATVIVPARRPDHARIVLRDIPRVEVGELDLLDGGSIDAFARGFIESARSLNILIDSAGVMATPLQRDARGYELQFATNHLGHFQLAARLWPSLRSAGDARIVSVSSRVHRRGGVNFEDPNFKRREYRKWDAYAQAKSANALFAVAMDARGKAYGVRAFSLHPGFIATDLSRHLSGDEMLAMGFRDMHGDIPAEKAHLYKTVEQGAATSVWCATSKLLDGLGGVYCEDVDVAETVQPDAKRESGVRPWAIDADLAERLWILSEGLTGVAFNI
jgi:NAD(P)-dependent dehydrogenase (short-subunit alcohol dehydrogenase family)